MRKKILFCIALLLIVQVAAFAAWPSSSARTKDWGDEVLTDSDLEAQYDILHTYINAMMSSTSGHKHDATAGEGPKIATLASTVSGTIDFSGDTTHNTITSDGDVIVGSDVAAEGDLTCGDDIIVGDDAIISGSVTVTEIVTVSTASSGTPAADTIYSDNIIKAWMTYDGETETLNDSFNVASVTRNSAGNYTIVWDRDFATANYAIASTTSEHMVVSISSKAAGSVVMITRNVSNVLANADDFSLIVVGDQ